MTNNQNCEVCDRLDCPTLTMPDMPDWCKDRDRMKLSNADYGWWASNRNKIQNQRREAFIDCNDHAVNWREMALTLRETIERNVSQQAHKMSDVQSIIERLLVWKELLRDSRNAGIIEAEIDDMLKSFSGQQEEPAVDKNVQPLTPEEEIELRNLYEYFRTAHNLHITDKQIARSRSLEEKNKKWEARLRSLENEATKIQQVVSKNCPPSFLR